MQASLSQMATQFSFPSMALRSMQRECPATQQKRRIYMLLQQQLGLHQFPLTYGLPNRPQTRSREPGLRTPSIVLFFGNRRRRMFR